MNPMINGGRQPSRGGTSRMNREVHVRFCEGLGVKSPGPTRPTLPTWAMQQVGSYPGYIGRDGNVVAKAAPDPVLPSRQVAGGAALRGDAVAEPQTRAAL